METKDPYGTGDGKGREGVDELMERRRDEEWKRRYEERRRRPRIAALMARLDAGELDTLGELESRLQADYRELVSAGKSELADACWDWGLARIGDVERAGEYAGREDEGAEAPARWTGLRVRVSYVAGRGAPPHCEIVGRLAGTTQRGLHVLMDDLEEERDGETPALAGTIARRVRAERFVTWASLLAVQPLPVRAHREGV